MCALQADMRNVVIMLAKGIGLCGVDKLLYDDGKEGLSPQEAISFMRIQVGAGYATCLH